MRILKGGTSRHNLFSKAWNLQLWPQEVITPDDQAKITLEIQSLKTKNKSMEKRIFTLPNKLKEVNGHEAGRQYKPSEMLGERQKRRIKRARENVCRASLGWLEEEGYTPVTVKLLNKSTGSLEEIRLENVENLLGEGINSDVNTTDLDMLNMIIYVKDSYNVSNVAYREMAQICKQLPRHYKVKERISELNKQWNI